MTGSEDAVSSKQDQADGEGRGQQREQDETPILDVRNLKTHFSETAGWLRREVARVRAVDGISFRVGTGEIVGLLGESGCGKTTTALSVLDLVDRTEGVVRFDGTPIDDLDPAERRSFRRRVQLIVQDPDEAFNPRMTVGKALAEPLWVHGVADQSRRRTIVEDTLSRIGLSQSVFDRYPHEFSGGELQRLAIARALVLEPDLLIADEPTSALDGRARENLLELLAEIRNALGVSILLISHDIEVARRFCDRVAVMYLGEIVELGAARDVLERPAHPYTRVLVDSVPSLEPGADERVEFLTDLVPDSTDPPAGCRFHDRCPAVIVPDAIDIEFETWRSVAAFRYTLEAGELPPGIDPEDPAVGSAAVRDAVSLPEPIPAPEVETVVDEAAELVAQGELQRATAAFDSLPASPCERESPTRSQWKGSTVRCHRYDPDLGHSPRPWKQNR